MSRDQSAVELDREKSVSPSGGVVVAVSITAVAVLAGMIYYQTVTGAASAEIASTADLADTIGKAGLGVFAFIELANAVIST